jgi:hypothetical protein
MKMPLVLKLLATALALAAACAAQTASPKFTLTITAAKTSVPVGSPMAVVAEMKNVSDRDIYTGITVSDDGVQLHHIDIRVLNKDGQPVPETDRGMLIHGRRPRGSTVISHAVAVPVAPGESTPENFDLAKEFDLTKPGEYTVQAQRMDYPTQTLVKSNTITFTITK